MRTKIRKLLIKVVEMIGDNQGNRASSHGLFQLNKKIRKYRKIE